MIKNPMRIRFMRQSDLPRVAEIELGSFENPWCVKQFRKVVDQRGMRSCVAIVDNFKTGEDLVGGFMLYRILKKKYNPINLAVCPDLRRRGLGKSLVDRLIHKLTRTGKNGIEILVPEDNLNAQLFFRELGFRAVDIVFRNEKTYYGMEHCLRSFLTEDRFKMAVKRA